MGFNFKETKRSANYQMILGSLCIILGIFDRLFIYKLNSWRSFNTEGVIAIWMGVWFVLTGVIGHYAIKPPLHNQQPRPTMINTYLGFSIVATVFAGVLLICYSVGLSYIVNEGFCSKDAHYDCKYSEYRTCSPNLEKQTRRCRTSVGLGVTIIIFAVAEFVVSIGASVCCCNGCNGCRDTSRQQGQVVYLQTQGGPVAAYVMTQGPNGMPMAVPAMTGGAVYQVQTQAVSGQAFILQNPQATATMAPPKYIQGASGQVHVQNTQGDTAAKPLQQGVSTTSGGQQAGVNTDVPSEPPPVYMP